MSWLRTIRHALHYEPEVRLAYFQGYAFHKLNSGNGRKPRYVGISVRLAVYAWRLLKMLRIHEPRGRDHAVDVLAFAQTANQANSLATTLKELRRRNLVVRCVTAKGAAPPSGQFSTDKCQQITLSLIDGIKLAFLMVFRLPRIWQQLSGEDRRVARWHIDSFLQCHIYLIFFEKVIESTNPRLILMSNDHNAPQRCLLALARVKGIKTAYMQHASVSRLFPTLVFDYSLLDGQVANDTYMDCEPNKPVSAPVPAQRHIFLTGQKKPVRLLQGMAHSTVGLAINTLDDVKDVMKVVTAIAEAGHALRLRWHPAMGWARVEKIRQACSSFPSVELSDPLVESVGDFLAQLGVLVAANSSIHLEAAVAGVMPIYFEISPVSTWDYYGYVRNGVSAEAKGKEELLDLIGDVLSGDRKLNSAAVQAYSATFDTEWEGREGELAAGIIRDLLDGAEPSECWGYAGVMGSIESHRAPPTADHI